MYDIENKTCKAYPLNETFTVIGIPATARFVDVYVIGTNAIEEYGLTVNLWEDVPRVDSKELGKYNGSQNLKGTQFFFVAVYVFS